MISSSNRSTTNSAPPVIEPRWNAVWSLAIGVAGLITAEFLPVSLLTPMASELGITEGAAGQTISLTAGAAMVTSVFITALTQRFDRRWVLLSFCVLQIVSNLLVAFAPGFAVLLAGRLLLGIGIGGFWTMSAATALRLVPSEQVPKALSLIFGAVSVATVIAAPMGSFLGAYLGWRSVFLVAGSLGVIALVWQGATLPSMRSTGAATLGTLFRVLGRPRVKQGMLATLLVFMGYATFFTYLRPFLEQKTGVNANTLTTILLAFGLANLAGTTLARHALERSLRWSLAAMPLVMSGVVAGLVLFGGSTVIAAVLIAMWGMAFGVVQVGWPTWLTRTLPDEAESGGGLQVATVQLAITLGAAVGGLVFDLTGSSGVYIGSSFIALLAAAMATLAFRSRKYRTQLSAE